MKEKILEIIDNMQAEVKAILEETMDEEDEQYYSGVAHACAVLKIAIEGIE